VKESGDLNSASMYLVVLYVPCAIIVVSTIISTSLVNRLSGSDTLSYLIPLTLLVPAIMYPNENWRTVLVVAVLSSTFINDGLIVLGKRKTNSNTTNTN